MFLGTPDIDALRGRLLQDERLARYTSLRVGGAADYLYQPQGQADLAVFLQKLPIDIPVTWLGLGSNVLIRDGGIRGAVIVTQGGLQQMAQLPDEKYVLRVEAGVSCAGFARFAARLGLTGVEFMAGIPGTIGGALAMNAGCYGGETWQRVQQVETVDRAGVVRVRAASEFEAAYRCVKKPVAEWFVAACFILEAGEREKSLAMIRALLEKRNAAQPTGLPNCGSVFRNPEGDYAARLIEAAGLKNLTVGGASVSEKHANFIVNRGGACARDIETLITLIQKKVIEVFDVALQPEVCMLGEE